MSEEEIKLDRYAKFRKLGHFEEFPVLGGLWREARAERAEVRAPRAPWIDKNRSHTCEQLLSWQPLERRRAWRIVCCMAHRLELAGL